MRVPDVRPVRSRTLGQGAPFTVIPASERESRRGGVWTPAFAGVTTEVSRNRPNVLKGGPE